MLNFSFSFTGTMQRLILGFKLLKGTEVYRVSWPWLVETKILSLISNSWNRGVAPHNNWNIWSILPLLRMSYHHALQVSGKCNPHFHIYTITPSCLEFLPTKTVLLIWFDYSVALIENNHLSLVSKEALFKIPMLSFITMMSHLSPCRQEYKWGGLL